MATKPDLCFVHFNDAYHIESRSKDPCGGAARFHTVYRRWDEHNPLRLFSGDLFNPSLMSTVFKGKQMVGVLNRLGVHYSCIGNHDFDFGIDALKKLLSQTDTKWLMSNCFDKERNEMMAGGATKQLIEWQGVKIGLVGLIEEEWITTLTMDTDNLEYTDFVSAGRKLAQELRAEGAQLVIALTHMRTPNDVKLAKAVPEINIVMGGHDHFDLNEKHGDSYVIKSGNDFRNVSRIFLYWDNPEKTKFHLDVKLVDVNLSEKEDPEMVKIVSEYVGAMQKRMGKKIGAVDVQLDARTATCRLGESNVGNLICDTLITNLNVDCAMINGGTIRSDDTYGPGDFTLRDLLLILPFEDKMVAITVTGQNIWDALENGVSQVPKQEGRFPQVGGIRFTYDSRLESGKRVLSVEIGGKPVDLKKNYNLACKSYMAEGKDGYECLEDKNYTLEEENGPLLSCLLRMDFLKRKVVQRLHEINHAEDYSAVGKAVAKFKGEKQIHFDHISPVVDGRIHDVAKDK